MDERQIDALFARYVEHLVLHEAHLEVDELASGDAELAAALRERIQAFQGIDEALGRRLQPLTGKTLGRYHVLEKLGAGGMADVYRAEDKDLRRDVAIKVLPLAFAWDPERRMRFEREARILAALDHRNIAAIHGLERAEGLQFLVLELVPGATLEERIGRGPLPVGEALPLFKQIALALETAHAKGIIHRDLKPANVKITPDGTIKVLDFGLGKTFGAQKAREGSESVALSLEGTVTGLVLGTASYMSPEQARGQAVDLRTDVWSFGCVLYEALSGRRAFSGANFSEVVAAILEREPDFGWLPADTPAAVQTLLRRCLEKEPSQRFQSAQEIAFALEEVAGKAPTVVPKDRVLRRGGLTVVAVLLLAGAGHLLYRSSPREPAPPPPLARGPQADSTRLPGGRTIPSAAADAFFQGSLEARKLTAEGLRESIHHYERAVAIDPSFALAHLGLAQSWLQLSNIHLPPIEAMPRARESAENALELEPGLAEAHVVLAAAALYYDWNWIEAEGSLRRAIELKPGLAPAHSLFGNYLLTLGRVDEALQEIQRAQTLDPRSVAYHFDKVWALLTARRYGEALTEGRRAIAFDSGYAFGHSVLGLAEALNGDRAQAVRSLQTAVRLENAPIQRTFLALGHALTGNSAEARAQLREVKRAAHTRYTCAYEVASVHAVLGERDEAFEWLEKGINERCDCMVWLDAEHWLYPIRSDPRFAALYRKFASLSRRPRS